MKNGWNSEPVSRSWAKNVVRHRQVNKLNVTNLVASNNPHDDRRQWSRRQETEMKRRKTRNWADTWLNIWLASGKLILKWKKELSNPHYSYYAECSICDCQRSVSVDFGVKLKYYYDCKFEEGKRKKWINSEYENKLFQRPWLNCKSSFFVDRLLLSFLLLAPSKFSARTHFTSNWMNK